MTTKASTDRPEFEIERALIEAILGKGRNLNSDHPGRVHLRWDRDAPTGHMVIACGSFTIHGELCHWNENPDHPDAKDGWLMGEFYQNGSWTWTWAWPPTDFETLLKRVSELPKGKFVPWGEG